MIGSGCHLGYRDSRPAYAQYLLYRDSDLAPARTLAVGCLPADKHGVEKANLSHNLSMLIFTSKLVKWTPTVFSECGQCGAKI